MAGSKLKRQGNLSRQDYVDAALKVIGDVGVEQLSLRKVAGELGVSAMAMYKHFANREALLSEALDAFIESTFTLPGDDLDWDDWVEQVARGMYQSLCQEMSWVPLLGSMRLGTRAATVTDRFVHKLVDAGFTPEQALQGYFAMIQTVVGAVCLRSSIRLESEAIADGSRDLSGTTLAYLENLDSERLKLAPVLESVVQQDQLDISLPLLLSALRAQIG